MQSRYTFEDDGINKVHQDFGRYPRRCFSCGHRGRTASDPTAPAQIPACGVPAPGSSGRLASAVPPRHAHGLLASEDARGCEGAPPGRGATGPETRSTYSSAADCGDCAMCTGSASHR
jgi:hypothetical protein